jgi:hypothetical protein
MQSWATVFRVQVKTCRLVDDSNVVDVRLDGANAIQEQLLSVKHVVCHLLRLQSSAFVFVS